MATQNEKLVNETEEDGIFADCSFTDLGMSVPLSEQLKERMGFTAPTLIQKRTIPSIISGRDVLVNAGTGTGKTIVYLAPIINRLQAHSPKISRTDGAFALVIVPTRELCLQVYEVLQKLLHRFHWIVPGHIMGGENRSKEKARLRKGINILIATPGRLLDHLKHTSSFTHNRLNWLIFDEADRLFDLGFGKAVEEILLLLKSTLDTSTKSKESVKVQQNILLSATLTEQVNNLAKISLKNPITIGLDDKKPLQGKEKDTSNLTQNLVSDEKNGSCGPAPPSEYKFPAKLVQRYMKIPCRLRLVALLGFLQSQVKLESSSKIVVFFSTCDAVDFHYALINQFHWNSPVNLGDDSEENFLHCKLFRLHGNMTQDERKDTFHGFSKEDSAVLLCTDVAARGLDFPKVRCIVQYDSPGDATEYVHRVGRTARLDQKGEAMLFLQPIELDYLKELQNHGVHLNEMQVEKILNILQPSSNKMKGGKWAVVEMHPAAIAMQKALEAFILTEESMKQLAKDAFCSFVRSYAAHRGDLKRIFQVKKLHLGHVAKSFGLKDQPSLVGKSFNKQNKKRQRAEKLKHGPRKKRRNTRLSVSSGIL